MRGEAFAAMGDLTALLAAVLGFSVLFGSLAGALAMREETLSSARRVDSARAFLDAVMDDPRWTASWGVFRRDDLERTTAADVGALTNGRAYVLEIVDVVTGVRWTFGDGSMSDPWVGLVRAGVVVFGDRAHAVRIVGAVSDVGRG